MIECLCTALSLSRFFMCIKGQHGKDIASQGLWEKFTRRATRNCLVKRQKKSDKEFSIIPYHSACPCEHPCVATSAFGEPRLRSLCVQASFHTLAGTSFCTEKSRSRKYCSAVNHLKASSGTSHIGCCCLRRTCLGSA